MDEGKRYQTRNVERRHLNPPIKVLLRLQRSDASKLPAAYAAADPMGAVPVFLRLILKLRLSYGLCCLMSASASLPTGQSTRSKCEVETQEVRRAFVSKGEQRSPHDGLHRIILP